MNSKHLAEGSKLPYHDKAKLRFYTNRFCPYAQRVQLVLDAKNLPYETVNINLSNKPEWLYDKSFHGKIPALELETGDVIYGSLIIPDYLDGRYSQNPLHSADPLQKTKDRLLIEQFSQIISVLYKMLLQGNRGCWDEYHRMLMDGLDRFEKELARRHGPYFGGDNPGMLDLMIWPWCERADLLKIFGSQFVLGKDKYKFLVEWRKLMIENSIVKKSLIESGMHFKFIQSYRVGAPDYDLLLAK